MNDENARLSAIWAQLKGAEQLVDSVKILIRGASEDLKAVVAININKQPEVTHLEDLKEPTNDEILKEEVQTDVDEQAMRDARDAEWTAKEMAKDDKDPLAPFA